MAESVRESLNKGHIPVLLWETVSLLSPADGRIYLDCTFGAGGHSRAILQSAKCRVEALDRDPDAAVRAKEFKKEFGARFSFFERNFSQLDKQSTNGYAGVLMDLGVSSFQLDEGARGFSILRPGPLDMRMNPSEGVSAKELVESLDEDALARILRDSGEEPRFRKIAKALKEASLGGCLNSTEDLAEVVSRTVGNASRGMKIHPATRTFQALRIAVNDELGEIEKALPKAFDKLAGGGVLAVISFHSLEDRIVKRFFKKMAGRPVDSHDRSFVQDREKLAEILTNKPVVAGEEEIAQNPRSRSAKLRAIRKL